MNGTIFIILTSTLSMDIQYLPSTVIHDIVNQYLTGHKISYIVKEYLCLNEQTFATILRSSYELDLNNSI